MLPTYSYIPSLIIDEGNIFLSDMKKQKHKEVYERTKESWGIRGNTKLDKITEYEFICSI